MKAKRIAMLMAGFLLMSSVLTGCGSKEENDEIEQEESSEVISDYQEEGTEEDLKTQETDDASEETKSADEESQIEETEEDLKTQETEEVSGETEIEGEEEQEESDTRTMEEKIRDAAIDEESGMQRYATSIAVGGIYVAICSDGTVVHQAYGGYKGIEYYDVLDTWENIIAVSEGRVHVVGLKEDGTVVSALNEGSNVYQDYGQCNTDDWTDIVMISAGDWHTVGLKSDGTVVAVGNNAHGECDVEDWTNIIMIATGYDFTVGLSADGIIYAVGNNYYNQCYMNGKSGSGYVAVGAGSHTSYAITEGGGVSAWGDLSGVSGDVRAVCVDGGDFTAVLFEDGSVIGGNRAVYNNVTIDDWENISELTCTSAGVLGKTFDGDVIYNAEGKNTVIWTAEELQK